MVIKKVQRFLRGNARQPQRELRQLDRHRIYVHAVNAGFNDTATPVRDFRLLLRNAGRNWHLATRNNLLARYPSRTVRNDLLGHRARGPMLHDFVGQPLGGPHKK